MDEKKQQMSQTILALVGGAGNVTRVTTCLTRLRFELKDNKAANPDEISQVSGVMGSQFSAGQLQVIIGTDVEDVYKLVCKELENPAVDQGMSVAPGAGVKKADSVVKRFVGMIASIFTPILGVLCGSGLLKGFLIALTTLNLVTPESSTYQILNASADAIFYFLPLALSITAAKRFGANQFLSFAVVGSLIYPSIVSLAGTGAAVTFLGIPTMVLNYSGTIIPAIVSVYLLSLLEKQLIKIMPKSLRTLLVPALCLIIIVPVSLIVIGPVVTFVANGISNGYTWAYGISPLVAGLLLGALWQIMVVFGVHWMIVPIVFMNLEMYGFDTITAIVAPATFTQAGAALGVFLKTKNKALKQIAGAAAVSAALAITEPAMYGVTLKYRKTFVLASITAGVAGAIIGVFGCATSVFNLPSLLTIPAYMTNNYAVFVICSIGSIVVSAALVYYFGYQDEKDDLALSAIDAAVTR